MKPQAAELLRSCDLTPLFIDVLGWERNARPLPVTVVEIGVASPRALAFRLAGVAQKRGAQVFLCPPDEYGRVPSQTVRRLIQDQVGRIAHHNVVVFADASRQGQVWQWAEQRAERRAGEGAMRVYEHPVGDETQAAGLLDRLAAITFTMNEEARLTLVDVIRRLRAAFADGHKPNRRSGSWRAGLAAYDLAEMDQGLRFWWEQALRQPRLSGKDEYPLACAMRRGDARALDLMIGAHLHLVARIAWRVAGQHRCQPADYLDLVQIANLEMIRLAPGFDPDDGARFQTFLTPRIQKTLRRVLAGEEGLIPIPRYVLDMVPRIAERRAAVGDRLTQRLGRTPFESEVTDQLAAEYQVSSENVARVLLIRDGFLSWDALAAELEDAEAHQEDRGGDANGREEVPSAHALMIHSDPNRLEAATNLVRREQLDAVLNNLTPRERDVVRMRFGLDDGDAHTLEEIGQRLAVTRERVRQIEMRAIKKLRRMGPITYNEKGEIVSSPPPKQPRVQEGHGEVADSEDGESCI